MKAFLKDWHGVEDMYKVITRGKKRKDGLVSVTFRNSQGDFEKTSVREWKIYK